MPTNTESMRIISLSSNISMILAALGLTSKVIGKTAYCANSVAQAAERPELKDFFDNETVSAWKNIEELGQWLSPDADKIAMHKPDLVLASGTCTQYTDKSLGISSDRWLHFKSLTLNDLYDSISCIGERTGRQERSKALIKRLKESALKANAPIHARKIRKPRIVHERCICIKPQLYANPTESIMIGGHLAPEIIEMAGGLSGLSSPGEPCRWIQSQLVIDYRPDIIVDNRCTACPLRKTDRIEDRAGWENIPAVKNKRIFRFNTNIANPNLCFVAGLEELVSVVLGND